MNKAIIFDMDGVLVEAKDWHKDALNDALRMFGFEITQKEHEERFDGLPTKNKLILLTQEKGLPFGLHDIINNKKQEYTINIMNERVKPNQDQIDMLRKLKQDGYKLAVCSNSISKTIKTVLEKANIMEYFDFYLSNEDVKNPKPSSEIYDKAIQKMSLQPNQVLIIEDNFNGIKAAKASGANVMEVKNTKDVTYDNIIKYERKL